MTPPITSRRPDTPYGPRPIMGRAVQPIPPLEHARIEQAGADEGQRRLMSKVRSGVGSLFGNAVAGSLADDVEYSHERWLDACRLFEQAIDRRDDTIDEVKDHLDEVRQLNGRLWGVTFAAANEVHRRFKGRPLPEPFVDLVELAGEQYAVMYRPTDERHQHDTDAGGNCWNNACSFNSDVHHFSTVDEPF